MLLSGIKKIKLDSGLRHPSTDGDGVGSEGQVDSLLNYEEA